MSKPRANRPSRTTGTTDPLTAAAGPGGAPPASVELSSHFPERAMSRAVASPRIEGNRLQIQFDGPNTFDTWIDAIGQAERYVHFENYIIRDDRIGRIFRDVLIERAREGVEVRVLHDWVGCWATPRRYWRPFREAGVEVRAFNRPTFRDPLGILQRDHRKLVCVDGEVAFIGGLCVGEEWAGSGDTPPWRDTGVEIRGPAAAASARAFERIWEEIGAPVPASLRADPERAPVAGSTPVWLIEGLPWRSRVYRTQQLVAANARERIWITDPYFVAPRPVTEALTAAARDGVDVRILVPAHNNWPWVGSLSRGGYRFLLEAGVRIFEWQGPMIHAKTSVCDGVWSRIGSSNLNAASLLGNWEIDVGVLDRELALQMEGLFLADLASSVEIILPGSVRVPVQGQMRPDGSRRTESLDPEGTFQERIEQWLVSGGRSGIRMADLMRAGSSLGDAMAGHRILGREDRAVLGTLSISVLVVAALAAFFPRAFAWTFAFLLAWFGVVTGVRALAQARRARALERRHRGGGRDDDPEGAAGGPGAP